MADFDLAYAINADGSGAVAAVDKVIGANKRLEASAGGIAGKFDTVTTASGRAGDAIGKAAAQTQAAVIANANLSAAQTKQQQAANALTAALQKQAAAANADAAEQEKLGRAVEAAQLRASIAIAGVTRAQAQAARASDTTTAALNRNAFGARNVGQQFGDLGLSIASGISPARAFGQQAGQLGFALSEMGGTAGKVGAFLVGPWGIALTVAAAVLAPFVEKLFETETASKAAEVATSGLADAESILADVFGKTSSKIAEQNELLKLNARIKAINLRADAAKDESEARKALAATGNPGRGVVGARVAANVLFGSDIVGAAGVGRGNKAAASLGQRAQAANRLTDSAARTAALDRVLQDAEKTSFEGSGIDKTKFIEAVSKSAGARANKAIADLLDESLNSGRINPLLDKAARSARPKKPPKPKSTEARDEFGRDAGAKIAGIVAAFDGTPPVLRQVNSQIAQLDDLIDDLSRKKPLNFETLIADAREAKAVVRDGLNKPFNDFVKSQRESLAVLKLTTAGRYAEAEALRIVQGLEGRVGELTAERKAAVLATVQAIEAEQRAIDVARAKAEIYLDALGDIKQTVDDATQAFVRGDLGQFIKTPGKLVDAFQTLKGRALFEGLFGDAFRKLQDQVNGTTVVEDASERMADALDLVVDTTGPTATAFDDLATAARGAAGALNGVGPTSAGLGVGSLPGGAGGTLASLLARGNGVTGPPTAEDMERARNGGEPDIVVRGRPERNPLTSDPKALFTEALGAVGGKVAGLFTNKDNAKSIGTAIGAGASKAIGGAATGQAVSGLAKAIGVKLNSTGSQIGGAVGSFIPIPGGQIIGSIVGGLIGNLFDKPKFGTAAVSSQGGQASTAVGGSNSATKGAASGLAGAVQNGVAQIAQQLGGALGDYKVSIGTFDGKYRVSTTGFTGSLDSKKAKGQGLADFGKDGEAAAIAYAIRDAIADGAVRGLSAAVQRALNGNSDIDKAVAEAVKVQGVELLIGGLGSQLKKTFDDAAAVAADRVRIAKTYGLDLVAVERINGEQRAKLVADTLKASVGSLQDVLTSITSGDLFEGTASEKRSALLTQIADARKRADAGEAGAGDEVANLYRTLLSTSRDAFGTAGGEYTSDRSTVATGAAAIIKSETDRINAAAGIGTAQVAAIQAGNALANETNNMLAVTNNALLNLPVDIASRLALLSGGGGGGDEFGYSTARLGSIVGAAFR